MKKEVEFGIRVSVKDGKVAASDIKEIGDAATAAASQIDKSGQSITSDLEIIKHRLRSHDQSPPTGLPQLRVGASGRSAPAWEWRLA